MSVGALKIKKRGKLDVQVDNKSSQVRDFVLCSSKDVKNRKQKKHPKSIVACARLTSNGLTLMYSGQPGSVGHMGVSVCE